MQNIYSHDEIVAFVDGHLKKMGTSAMNDGKIAAGVVGWISQLPPLFQVLTVESGHDIVFADPGVMDRLFKDADKSFRGNVLGFYSSTRKKFDNVYLNHPVFFYRGSRGGINAATASHEKTHDFDFMLGKRRLNRRSARFYSSMSKEWEYALERQIEKFCSDTEFENENPAALLCWSREELSSVFAAQSKGKSLYDDYRPLLNHLSLYDTKSKRMTEAVAEMGAHYAMLYAQTGGDECAIDLKLTARYPDLWEEFRDNMLPQYEEMAREFLAARDMAIMDYAARAARLARRYGLDMHEDDFVRKGAIAHAGGRLDEALDDLKKLWWFYRNPVDHYAAAVRDRDGLYFQHGDRSIAAADDAYQRRVAMKMLQADGFSRLGEAYLDIEREMTSFRRYLYAYDRIMCAYEAGADAEKFFSFLTPGSSAAESFCDLYANGGAPAVDEHLSWLPSSEQVSAFKKAKGGLLSLRDEIAEKPAGVRPISRMYQDYKIINDLRDIFESRCYNEIENRKDALAAEGELLRDYSDEISMLADMVSFYTGAQGVKPAGRDILKKYDEIKTEKGMYGIRQAIEGIAVSGEEIREYVSLRKSCDDWLQSIDEHGKNSVPFIQTEKDVVLVGGERKHSNALLAGIADELMAMAFGEDMREGMEIRKAALRRHIASLKNHATGVDTSLVGGRTMAVALPPPAIRNAVAASGARRFEP